MRYTRLVIGVLLVFLMSVSGVAAYHSGGFSGDNYRYYEDYQRDYRLDESESFTRDSSTDYNDPYYYDGYGYDPYSYGRNSYGRNSVRDRESFSSSTSFERHDRYTREYSSDYDYYRPSYRSPYGSNSGYNSPGRYYRNNYDYNSYDRYGNYRDPYSFDPYQNNYYNTNAYFSYGFPDGFGSGYSLY